MNTELAFGETELENIIGADRCVTLLTAAKQREGGRRVGTKFSKHYFICVKYLKRYGSANHSQT